MRISSIGLVLVITSISSQVFAQGYQISGSVNDIHGQPLPGVNILIKGTPTGTVAGIDGCFKIAVPKGRSTLLFAFIGFKSLEQEVDVQDGRTYFLEITLVSDRIKIRKSLSSAKLVVQPIGLSNL